MGNHPWPQSQNGIREGQLTLIISIKTSSLSYPLSFQQKLLRALDISKQVPGLAFMFILLSSTEPVKLIEWVKIAVKEFFNTTYQQEQNDDVLFMESF